MQCSIIAAELVRHNDARLAPAGHQPGNKPFGGARVASGLDQGIKNQAVAVYCTPKPVLYASDHNDHFIQMPFITGSFALCADPFRDPGAEFPNPRLDRFITNRNTPLSEQILNVAQTQGEAMVGPDRMGNYWRREMVAFEAGAGNRINHLSGLGMC